jgi:hypothetical protein
MTQGPTPKPAKPEPKPTHSAPERSFWTAAGAGAKRRQPAAGCPKGEQREATDSATPLWRWTPGLRSPVRLHKNFRCELSNSSNAQRAVESGVALSLATALKKASTLSKRSPLLNIVANLFVVLTEALLSLQTGEAGSKARRSLCSILQKASKAHGANVE